MRARSLAITSTPATRHHWRDALRGLCGGTLGIGLLGWLGLHLQQPLLMAPFGASCVLLFALPESPLAQPRNLLFGHLLAATVGLAMLALFGAGVWQVALAVGLAIGLMRLSQTLHPPAGANPIVIMLGGHAHWSFLLDPVLAGVVILLVCALGFNNALGPARWPTRWR